MKEIYDKIITDPRYQANLDWGEARPGHPEGTIRAHIAELERNLQALRHRVTEDEYWKLKVLIHTHDTFKPDARPGSPITHPRSHASLARQFLAESCTDGDLLNMVQYHDEWYALWQRYKRIGFWDCDRFQKLLQTIRDWDLFLVFLIIDGCTEGKDREPLVQLLTEVRRHLATRVTLDWVL